MPTMTREGSLIAELRKLADERQALKDALDDNTERLARAASELVSLGFPETRIAKEAGVSRATVRVWVGKQDWDTWRGKADKSDPA